MGVSDRIREAASINNMSLKEFSERIGVSYRTVQNYVAGERGVGAEFLTAVSEQMGVSATWILTGLGAPLIRDATSSNPQPNDSRFVPVAHFTAEASAGHGSLVQDEAHDSTYAYSRAFLERRRLKPNNLAVISVRGDSMTPDLHDGDKILVDCAPVDPARIEDGQIHVVSVDGALYVKRILHVPGKRLMLASSNPAYPPITVEAADMNNVRLIGRVVSSSHEW